MDDKFIYLYIRSEI